MHALKMPTSTAIWPVRVGQAARSAGWWGSRDRWDQRLRGALRHRARHAHVRAGADAEIRNAAAACTRVG